jgi:hypothetical protein
MPDKLTKLQDDNLDIARGKRDDSCGEIAFISA